MKELVEYIVKAVVDFPENVTVTQVEGENTTVFELRVRREDIGKVIGKKGRTINALRTILNATAAKAEKRAMLEIIEEAREAEEKKEAREEEAPETGPSSGNTVF